MNWFYGSCVISIRDLLLTDYFNVINLETGEILVKETNPRKSYFKNTKPSGEFIFHNPRH